MHDDNHDTDEDDMSNITKDSFMADRGHPYMTQGDTHAAEAEWKLWEEHIATGGCPRYATVEIRPDNGNFEDLTHSCDSHIGDLLGHRPGMPAPHCYEVRPFTGDEARKHWCCQSVEGTPAGPTHESPTMTPTPANLLFCASRALRTAACEYANANAEDAAEDKLHQAALDYALVANAIDGQRYAVLGAIDEETKLRILGPVAP